MLALLLSTINKQSTIIPFQPPPPLMPTGPAASPLSPTATTAISHHRLPTTFTAHTNNDTNKLPMPHHGSSAAVWIGETTWQMCHVIQTVTTCHHRRVCSGEDLPLFSISLSHPDAGDIGTESGGQRGGGRDRVVDREEGGGTGWWTDRREEGQGVVDR